MKSLNNLSLFFLTLLVSSLTSCDENETIVPSEINTERTIICYMPAENSLSSLLQGDIDEMVSCAREMGVNDRIVIYLDDTANSRIYVVDRNTTALSSNSLVPVFTSGQDYNSCSKEIMKSFFRYVMINYPSNSYGLIFNTHGLSWLPPTNNVENEARVRKSFGVDNGENSFSDLGDEMRIVDLAESIRTLPHLDFIFFDLCYMQSIEIAYELRDCADYIVGSPAEIPGSGAPYDKILPMLFAKNIDYQKIIDTYADSQAGWQQEQPDCGVALSVVKCDYLDSLKTVTSKMYAKYGDKIKECRYNGTTIYLDKYYTMLKYHVNFFDMREIMLNMLTEEEFAEWDAVYNKAVPYYYTAPYIFSGATKEFVPTNPKTCGVMAMSLCPSDTKNAPIISEYESLQWRYW